MKNALVIGSGSGIGAALVDRLAARPDINAVAAAGRHEVCSIDPKVRWIQVDAVDGEPADIRAALAGQIERIHLMFVTLGVLHGAGMAPEKSIRQFDDAAASRAFSINAIAPLKAVSACLPLLMHAEGANVCVLSAKVGSIDDNRLGGWYAYRMSKAALNMGVKTLAIELARRKNHPTLMAVHPGTTRSPLSLRFLHSDTRFSEAPETADRLINLASIDDPSRHGEFLHWDGTPLPW